MANGNNGTQSGTGRRWAVIAGILVLLIVVAVLIQMFRPVRIRVTTTRPSRTDITSFISTNGKVEPVQNFEARAPIPTNVRRIYVKEGEKVKKGQLLIQLDDADARMQLTKAIAQLRAAQSGSTDVQIQDTTLTSDLNKAIAERQDAQRNLDAVQKLFERGAASQAEVDAAKSRLSRANADVTVLQQKTSDKSTETRTASAQAAIANAKAAMDSASQVVSELSVRAPIDGTVYAIPTRQGFFVNTGDLVIQVADLSDMQVRAYVDEPEIGRLALGQAVKITWDALPGRTWNGTVRTLPSTVFNRGTRVIGEVLCNIANSDHVLLPFVNVGVTIVTSAKQNALVVPREAIHAEDGRNYIYVVKDQHLQRREVQLGVANLTTVEILNGISDGDLIAVNSVSPTPLRDGVWVKLVSQS